VDKLVAGNSGARSAAGQHIAAWQSAVRDWQAKAG
jgi:hypothetical protein